MIKVGLVGAIGFAGREFLRLLMAHPEAELVAAVEVEGGKRLDEVLPAFRKMTDVVLETFDAESLAKRCDVVFMGLPGTVSMDIGAALRKAGARVMDLGSDFRIKDLNAFTQYYKVTHKCPELVQESVYGLVPWYRDAIRDAQLVAVPGCFPISVITPLRPIVEAAAPEVPIVVNSVTGVSGGGRNPNEVFHFPNMNENLKAYKLAVHQHTPEIEQEIGGKYLVQFTPAVAPLTRGIMSCITLRPSREIDLETLYRCYDREPFVRVLPEGTIPDINHVRASNFCDIGWVRDERTGNILIVSCIDNLVGGTAGMGIQCMNVAFGLDERTGLNYPGMAP